VALPAVAQQSERTIYLGRSGHWGSASSKARLFWPPAPVGKQKAESTNEVSPPGNEAWRRPFSPAEALARRPHPCLVDWHASVDRLVDVDALHRFPATNWSGSAILRVGHSFVGRRWITGWSHVDQSWSHVVID